MNRALQGNNLVINLLPSVIIPCCPVITIRYHHAIKSAIILILLQFLVRVDKNNKICAKSHVYCLRANLPRSFLRRQRSYCKVLKLS